MTWQQTIRRMESFFAVGSNYRSILMKCDPIVSAGFATNFIRKVDENGRPWPPHAPETIRRYGVHPLLILTGRMYAAATIPSHPEHLRQFTGQSMRVGIRPSVYYAKFHHYGDAASRTPRRRVIFANQQTVATLQRTIEAEARKQMNI